MPITSSAIVYVPADQLDPHATRCSDHCETNQHTIAGIVTTSWADAVQAQEDLNADVIVVSTAEHIPAERIPRVEIVDQHAPPAAPGVPPRNAGPVPRRQRRPNQI